ncbi:hypothetical protein GCM10023336_10280 [Streptomyces similanensis]|uniref:Uncharacterized protein n=1 Tax=Streptomyces similanensis TaxID=1274988 RepID=A0ABP9JZY5_9ACTN
MQKWFPDSAPALSAANSAPTRALGGVVAETAVTPSGPDPSSAAATDAEVTAITATATNSAWFRARRRERP